MATESTQFLVLIPISLRSILILSFHLLLGLTNVLFPAGVPVKFFSLPRSFQIIFRVPWPCVKFLNKRWFLQCEMLSFKPNPQAGGPLLVGCLHNCLFSIFAANLYIWRTTPPSATRGDAPYLGDRNPRMASNKEKNRKII